MWGGVGAGGSLLGTIYPHKYPNRQSKRPYKHHIDPENQTKNFKKCHALCIITDPGESSGVGVLSTRGGGGGQP